MISFENQICSCAKIHCDDSRLFPSKQKKNTCKLRLCVTQIIHRWHKKISITSILVSAKVMRWKTKSITSGANWSTKKIITTPSAIWKHFYSNLSRQFAGEAKATYIREWVNFSMDQNANYSFNMIILCVVVSLFWGFKRFNRTRKNFIFFVFSVNEYFFTNKNFRVGEKEGYFLFLFSLYLFLFTSARTKEKHKATRRNKISLWVIRVSTATLRLCLGLET